MTTPTGKGENNCTASVIQAEFNAKIYMNNTNRESSIRFLSFMIANRH